jgi:nicotinamide mononucleotide transporter
MINLNNWISNNYIEVFGAITGIIYVILEIRQSVWLWPVGIVTSAVYIWVFYSSRFYADGSLQVYYLIISVLGWYWWLKGTGRRAPAYAEASDFGRHSRLRPTKSAGKAGHTVSSEALAKEEGAGRIEEEEMGGLVVTRLKMRTGVVLAAVFTVLYFVMWLVLSRFTNSPVPAWDSFITSLSIVATWMLARKIYEHWYLWIVVNLVSSILFLNRGLYPTVILYVIYCVMSFSGLRVWKKSL